MQSLIDALNDMHNTFGNCQVLGKSSPSIEACVDPDALQGILIIDLLRQLDYCTSAHQRLGSFPAKP